MKVSFTVQSLAQMVGKFSLLVMKALPGCGMCQWQLLPKPSKWLPYKFFRKACPKITLNWQSYRRTTKSSVPYLALMVAIFLPRPRKWFTCGIPKAIF